MRSRFHKWIALFTVVALIFAQLVMESHPVYAKENSLQSGIMLDCARRYYSVDEIKKYIDMLAVQSNSFLQLHLSDNENVGVECKTLGQLADDETKGADGSYWNADTHKQFLSCQQIQELLCYAEESGVSVIPEIDMPGHMNGFFRLAEQKYGYDYVQTIAVNQDEVLGELNITEEAGQTLANALLREYAELFQSCDYFHMGFDEYWTDYGDRMIDFMNQQAMYLQNQGFVVRIWNDLLTHDNISKVNHEIEVVFWSHDGATADSAVREQRIAKRLSVPELQEEGFKLIITNSYYLYFVPSARSCTQEALDYTVNDILNNWDLSRWDANYEGGLSSYKNINAAMIAIWGEDSEGIEDETIRTQADRMYHAMLQKIADVEVEAPDIEQETTTEEESTTREETSTEEEVTTREETTTVEEATTREETTTREEMTTEEEATTREEMTTEEEATTREEMTTEEEATTREETTTEEESTTREETTTEEAATTEKTTTAEEEETATEQAATTERETTKEEATTREETTTDEEVATREETTTEEESTTREEITTEREVTTEEKATTEREMTTDKAATTERETTIEETTTTEKVATTERETTTEETTTTEQAATTERETTTEETTTTEREATTEETTTTEQVATTERETTTEETAITEQVATTERETTAEETTTTEQVVTTEREPVTEQASTTEKESTSEEAATTKKATTQKTKKKKLKKVTGLKLRKLGSKTIKLSWKKQADCTGYKVYQYNKKMHRYKLLKTTSKNSIKLAKLRVQAPCKFKVRAYQKENQKIQYGAYSKAVKWTK